MKIETKNRNAAGVTLIEVLIAVMLVVFIGAGVFNVITEGFRTSAASQQSLRATQILDEQMENIRLYTWDQICSNGFIPTTFTAPYYTNTVLNTPSFNYTGTVSITDPGLSEVYSNDMKLITVTVTWNQTGIPEKRSMSTLVSRYGLHNYYYHYK